MSTKALEKLSDAELAEEEARLAEERTRIRLAQNAVTAERETRAMFAGLSGPTREALLVRLGGSIGSNGSTNAKESAQ